MASRMVLRSSSTSCWVASNFGGGAVIYANAAHRCVAAGGLGFDIPLPTGRG